MPVLPSARSYCAPTGVGRRPLAAALCVAAAVLGGCTIALPGWLGGGGSAPSLPKAPAASAAPLSIDDAGLLATRERRLELGLRLSSLSGETLWVSVRFQTPDGHDCAALKELPAQGRLLFTCPQARLVADADYPVTIQSWRDPELRAGFAPIATTLRFTRNDLVAAGVR